MQYQIKRTRWSYGWPVNVFRNLGYRARSTSKYMAQITAASDAEESIRQICKEHRFEILHVFGESDDRSSNYKKIFYEAYPEPKGGYRCRYCNKKLNESNMEIDHIYPVKLAKASKGKYRKRYGLTGVNDPNNLAASCSRCNRKKAGKAGLWIWRAKLGKYKAYWAAIYALRAVALTLIVALAVTAIGWDSNSQLMNVGSLLTGLGEVRLSALI